MLVRNSGVFPSLLSFPSCRGGSTASIEKEPHRLADGAMDFRGGGRRAQAQDHLEVKVVAQHADEVLRGHEGAFQLEVAAAHERFQRGGKPAAAAARTSLEEGAREVRE